MANVWKYGHGTIAPRWSYSPIGPGVTPWTNGYSLDFDGSDEHLTVSDSATVSASDYFTIGMWLRYDSTAGSNLIGKGQRNDDAEFQTYISSGVQYWTVNGGAGSTNPAYVGGGGWNTATWYFAAFVYNKDLLPGTNPCKIFRNGSEISYASNVYTGHTGPYTGATKDLTIACRIGTGGTKDAFFDGLISEVCWWNAVLDATQLTALYNSGTPIDPRSNSGSYTTSANLVAYWRMGDDPSDSAVGTIYERINNNNATPQNMEAGDKVTTVPP